MELQKIRVDQLLPNNSNYSNYKEEVLGLSLSFLQRFIAIENQSVFTLNNSYSVGNSKLKVFVNGIKMKKDIDYEETNPTTITFLYGLYEGDLVRVRVDGYGGSFLRNSHKHMDDDIPSEPIDGNNKIFSLTYVPQLDTECVFKNGILMYPGNNNDYIISSNIVTFTSAPKVGSQIKFSYLY